MTFNTGIQWNMADSAFGGGDFDWYDGGSSGEYLSPDQGGYPGGIPGYDDYQQGTTGPVAPDTPYDPYADEGPSQTNPNVVGKDDTIPNSGEVVITDDRPVAPDDLPDMGEMVITGSTPREPPPSITIDPIIVPDLELPDLTPYLPVEDVPEMTITDTRPVKPVEEDVPELVIKDTRPVTPEEPVIPITPGGPEEPVIPESIVPEPPVVTPPVINPPVVTPPVVNPPVTPPTTLPVTPVSSGGKYLNPGLIESTRFYNEASPTSNQFYWGSDRPLQYGDTFNPQTWNAVPRAEAHPWSVNNPSTVTAPVPVLNLATTDIQKMLSGHLTAPQGISSLTPQQLQELVLRWGRGG